MGLQRSWSKSIIAVALSAAAWGCGGASTQVNGTISGVAITSATAVTVADPIQSGGMSTPAIGINIANQPSLCADIMSNTFRKNEADVAFEIFSTDASNNLAAPAGAGTYTVIDPNADTTANGNYAYVTFSQVDASCNPVSSSQATASSGKITVTTYKVTSGGSIDGSFDITFGTDHITGSFNAPYCTATIPTTPGTCR